MAVYKKTYRPYSGGLTPSLARFLVIPPNDAHGRDLLAAELDARRHRRGLWGECGLGK